MCVRENGACKCVGRVCALRGGRSGHWEVVIEAKQVIHMLRGVRSEY